MNFFGECASISELTSTSHYISGGFRGGPRSGSLFRPYHASPRDRDRQLQFIALLIEDRQSGRLEVHCTLPLAQRPSAPTMTYFA